MYWTFLDIDTNGQLQKDQMTNVMISFCKRLTFYFEAAAYCWPNSLSLTYLHWSCMIVQVGLHQSLYIFNTNNFQWVMSKNNLYVLWWLSRIWLLIRYLRDLTGFGVLPFCIRLRFDLHIFVFRYSKTRRKSKHALNH